MNCKFCNKLIPNQEKTSEKYKKQFCNRSCSASYNNRRRKTKPEKQNKKSKTPRVECVCLNCESKFVGYSDRKFCSINCSSQYRNNQDTKKMYELFINGKQKYRRWVYRFLVERDGDQCSVCNITGDDWNGLPLRLWVDHINGDPSDHSPSNFRLICPNCESQTDTSRGKNYGNGRRSKGLPAYG